MEKQQNETRQAAIRELAEVQIAIVQIQMGLQSGVGSGNNKAELIQLLNQMSSKLDSVKEKI
jgi:hypothetical protein